MGLIVRLRLHESGHRLTRDRSEGIAGLQFRIQAHEGRTVDTTGQEERKEGRTVEERR